MKAYELLFFVDPNLDPETRLAVMKRIDNTIAEGNGKVDNVDRVGQAQARLRDRPSSPKVTTPSSTSMQTRLPSRSSIACFVLPTP